MFSFIEQNFIEKFFRESGFSNFGHMTFCMKRKFVFLAAILKRKNFLMFVLLIYGCLRDIQIKLWRKFHTEIPTEKYDWVQVDPPCAQTGVKSSLVAREGDKLSLFF